ncbi:class I SAM-dependent methyltransferase [Budvicia diplopodorum]|uniref:class I SAM-dependent methyltransferase n=1 Tax=Budvicia diplopodorum TaxID=1119056 RepID=UPI00135C086B|nr:methyltransferase domain-containing protein [Budvicia diplopodorum]
MNVARTSKILSPPLSWDELSHGHAYHQALELQLEPWWPKLFGFHLMKLGRLSASVNTEQCLISHHFNVSSSGSDIQVYADNFQLPFIDKTIDACLLANTLSYSEDPHRVLREVDRVLIDDGWLIISGFNPFSIVGAGKLIPFIRNKHPYCCRVFSKMRMIDWLSLLNYEVLYQSHFQVVPWGPEGHSLLSAHIPAVGCQTLIIARKRTIPLTLNPLLTFQKRFRVNRGAVGATKKMHNND